MRTATLSWLIAAALLSAGALAADKAKQAKSRLTLSFSTDYFRVRADPDDPYLARLLTQGATHHLRRVAGDLGLQLDPDRPFTLYIYPTHADFIRAGGLQARKFTVGTAASDDTISVDASGSFEPADTIMAHEITHAVIFRILGSHSPRLPLWLNEGLAKLESGSSDRIDSHILGEAAADDRIIPLSRLRESFPRDRVELAYAQSFFAVDYLANRHGMASLRRLLTEMASGRSFDEATLITIDVSGTDFEEEWCANTTRRYWAVRMTRIGAAVISFVMALLAVAAFLTRRKRKIEAARLWEQEEAENAVRRLLGDDRHR